MYFVKRISLIFESKLIPGVLIRRYKRFLADVDLAGLGRITAHCPNTGSMLGLARPGMRVWLREAGGTARKYRFSWELAEPSEGLLVGINTGRSNGLVQEALQHGSPAALAGFSSIRREVRVGDSRLDFLLAGYPGRGDCYVEVKNVTAAVSAGVALFPDAVSERASRHLRELAELRRGGARCALVYCVQRPDVNRVRPAVQIDPQYAAALAEARAAGVEVFALGARISPAEIVLDRVVGVEGA